MNFHIKLFCRLFTIEVWPFFWYIVPAFESQVTSNGKEYVDVIQGKTLPRYFQANGEFKLLFLRIYFPFWKKNKGVHELYPKGYNYKADADHKTKYNSIIRTHA